MPQPTSLSVDPQSRGQEGEAAVHWKPVKKTAAFDPLTHWSRLSQALHERFNWIAGPYQRQLGYEKKEFKGIRFLSGLHGTN